jgi:hypothetical protein
MRNIDESHFGPDSVQKINISYQNAKRKKLKESIKGKCFFLCNHAYMNSLIQ